MSIEGGRSGRINRLNNSLDFLGGCTDSLAVGAVTGECRMGEVIEFPFWERQDQVAVSEVSKRGGDLQAFGVMGADSKIRGFAPTRAAAIRLAYRVQQQTGQEPVGIYFREEPEEEYLLKWEISHAIKEDDLPMEEDLDE